MEFDTKEAPHVTLNLQYVINWCLDWKRQ